MCAAGLRRCGRNLFRLWSGTTFACGLISSVPSTFLGLRMNYTGISEKERRDRFWAKLDKSGKCWLWTGPLNTWGYGRTKWNYKYWSTHRLAYMLAKGPIPKGLTIDHLCRIKKVCNPEHLT